MIYEGVMFIFLSGSVVYTLFLIILSVTNLIYLGTNMMEPSAKEGQWVCQHTNIVLYQESKLWYAFMQESEN